MAEVTGRETAGGQIVLSQNNYGKSEVRLVKVKRDAGRHEVWDLDVAVALEGDFEAAHVRGDNSKLLATDTMRNTVYALAKDHLTASIEEDRKSTRLNSSHANISYAVFCLKK